MRLLDQVDVVLIESIDGRKHLEQARRVIAAGKPFYIDKPVAGSLTDAIEIYRLAAEKKVPCFSSSSVRFSGDVADLKLGNDLGDVVGCDSFAPCPIEPHHPDLFWYGVHGVELLFTIMHTGCDSVARTHAEGVDLVVGTWKDGRVGTFRGIRSGDEQYGALVFGTKGIVRKEGFGGYEPLVKEIAHFFRSRVPPVSSEETLEIFAFMEAADASKRAGGKPIKLTEVLQKARRTDGQLGNSDVVIPPMGNQ